MFSLWGAIMGGVNLLMHGAGWMEGGLHASYEKMILDAELLGMVAAFLEPVVVDEDTLAFSAMQEVGPGGHFFGAEHTQSRYRTAFHKPMLSDWRNYETWEEAGSPGAAGEGQPDLEGAARRVRAAADGPGHRARSSRPSSPAASPRAASRPTTEEGPDPREVIETQVVVIGGGVVGASVLYHLTKAGWTDVVLLERRELTAGSTWHAAGGMHTLNGDPNVARLQQYTIQLYEEIERVSGQDCSIHLPGGLMLADTRGPDGLPADGPGPRPLPRDGPRAHLARSEAQDLFPLLDPQYFVGALYDPVEGHVDPTGVTRAYVKCAQLAGAEVHQHTPVVGLDAARRRHVGRPRSRAATRSTPSTSSTPAGCGRARSAGWSASSCRSSPWSTCTC